MALSIRDRKVQLAVAGGVVAILAVFLLLKALGGGSENAVSPTPSVGSFPAPSVTPTVSPSPPPIIVFSGRDPFQDLFGTSTTTSPGGSTLPTSGGTGTPPSSGGTGTGTGGTTTPPPTSPGGGDGGGQGGTTIGGHSVLLDDVFVTPGGIRKAQVEVDGTVYTVAAGESFDGNFKLVSFPNASCAHFVYGDEGFTLCTSGGK